MSIRIADLKSADVKERTRHHQKAVELSSASSYLSLLPIVSDRSPKIDISLHCIISCSSVIQYGVASHPDYSYNINEDD
tara:strand:+ start:613 stop:849 length:237 start_codon:yes stop_codon:yes gene_type:complete